MPRRYITDLTPQEPIDEVFVAGDKQLRPNRAGNLYLQVELSDRSGSVTARLWNASDAIYRSFDNGDYLRVTGTAQLFQGAMQVIATKLHRVDPAEVDEADFAPLPAVEVDKLVLRLGEILRTLDDPPLRTLAECFLMDEPFMAKLMMAPAGTKNHHAYHGGLIEHIVGLMELVLGVCPHYPRLNRDMLVIGAFIHDLGKTDELSYEHGLAYTDEGQLIGHLVMAVELLNTKVAEAEKLSGEPIPRETVLRLKHLILSHHGEYAFGSPKLPMTLEAIALSMLDNLDAKINTFSTLMNEDPNVDSAWTTYNPNLERKLYKGRGERGEGRGERE
ncbi:MAG: OB-fold nucleic acid binding domain-containing protein [Thermoguttaceae bacterium]|jgi:3'-5' exoribonuclease